MQWRSYGKGKFPLNIDKLTIFCEKFERIQIFHNIMKIIYSLLVKIFWNCSWIRHSPSMRLLEPTQMDLSLSPVKIPENATEIELFA